MTRREFVYGAAGLAVGETKPRVLLTEAEVGALRAPARLAMQRDAALKAGPWSVTWHRPRGGMTKAGAHDFFSEGPYWWPDPKRPEGPYIRRDGEVNPERFTRNDDDLGHLGGTVLQLALDAVLNRRADAAARAWEVIRVWFLDAETRMSPHLEFGQAIRGVVDGRGIGIIDARPLIWCAQGVSLLRRVGAPEKESRGFDEWLREYLVWLTESPKGRDAQKNGNNHGTWWTAQALAYAVHLNQAGLERRLFDFVRDEVVPGQLEPDGSAPKEEARTKSLSYSLMNLDAFSLVCRMAMRRGVDLWRYRTPKGAGVLRSIEYIAPYAMEPERWKKQQIAPLGKSRGYFLGLAGLDLKRREWVEAQKSFGPQGGAWGMLLEALLNAA